MPTTNIIGPIDQQTWNALIVARAALKDFRKDTEINAVAIQKYTYIYKDTLSPYISSIAS